MPDNDQSKELLEKMLQELYAASATQNRNLGEAADSYLMAADNQYLGKITTNSYDQQSILNQYGPYGSPYSSTSIFNAYSQYGSVYGALSLNNPYSQQPPSLFIRGKLVGQVSENLYVPSRIPTKAFLYVLKKDLNSLLRGEVPRTDLPVRQAKSESFLEGNDDQFLGSLNPNNFDKESIFNKYGPYGSEYSQTSIFNKFGPYGGQFSQQSPFNKFSRTPPKIYLNGKQIALLTANSSLRPRIDPNEIEVWAQRNVSKKFR